MVLIFGSGGDKFQKMKLNDEIKLCSRQIMFSTTNLPVLSKYSGEEAVTWWRRRELPLMPLCLHLSPPLKTSLHKPLIAPQEVAENQLLIEHISAIPHQLWISLGGLW